MVEERNEHFNNGANKKHIDWIIGVAIGVLTIISFTVSFYKEWKELAILTVFLAALALLFYFFVSWKKAKNAKEFFENKSRVLEKENNKLRKETCKSCKRVYSYIGNNSISFDENFSNHSLPYESNNEEDIVDEKHTYYLENHIFISFYDGDNVGKCYLINFINGSIYLPIDNEWRVVVGNSSIIYRQLCSKRTNHLSFDKLI